MNGGGKAEKENTPSEANLQEEEVLRGAGLGGSGRTGKGGATGRGVPRARGCVHARPPASHCITFEDFPETFCK